MASKTGTLVPGNYSDCMVKKVSYKGFIHCDNKAREPTFHTVEGIHKIFQSKKLMKGAQGDNPLACRGFKRPVILSCMDDGFRLDMTSGEQEGALLQTHVNKIVLAMPVESSVYIVTRRGKDPGKYSCHCIKCDAKEKSVPDEIAAYFTRIVKGSDPDARAGVSTLKPAAQSHVPQPTRRRSEDGPGAHTQVRHLSAHTCVRLHCYCLYPTMRHICCMRVPCDGAQCRPSTSKRVYAARRLEVCAACPLMPVPCVHW
eukprot:m.316543 g.316543  ORF g.316543 m.316543 type:complete len:257 (+) comp20284_c0_seq31:166-936(+)